MFKEEYDFLSWTSFPSSRRLYSDEKTWRASLVVEGIGVKPGATLSAKVMAKQIGGLGVESSLVTIKGWDGEKWIYMRSDIVLPKGSFGWQEFNLFAEVLPSITIPSNINAIVIYLGVGSGVPSPTTVWFDDLKVFQDGVLIYSDDFSNWSPVIGAGVGAPIGGVAGYLLKEPLGPMVSEVVGAVVGGALGGGVGLLTAMGLVPQIPIPALGAAPEEPGAPMRLGKYQITG